MNAAHNVAKTALAWASTCSLAEIADRLARAPSAAVVTHAKPDGDAVGSCMAITRALLLRGRRAAAVFPPPWFDRFASFVGQTPMVVLPERAAAGDAEKHMGFEPKAIAVVDTGSWSQLGDARSWLESRKDRVMILDHHPSGDADVASVRHIEPRAAAACELAAEVCRMILGVDSVKRLPREVAEPLYLGLATDTGFFRYSNVTPKAMRLAADLMEAGADNVKIMQASEQSERFERLRLIARALQRLELLEANRVALIPLTEADLRETGADLDETGGLTDLPQTVATVRVVAVLTEIDGGVTKVSLRSKPPLAPKDEDVDVNQIARALGGGGHVRAAGAKIKAPLPEARERVLTELRAALKAAR